MKISQKGLYALQAPMTLARHHNQGAIKIRHIACEEVLPEKFLEFILLELKNVRMGDPSNIHLSEIVRLIDGPLAPLGDADQLRELIDRDIAHRMLYQFFLDVRDAAARILDDTSLSDLIADGGLRIGKKGKCQKNQNKDSANILPMVVRGTRE